MEKINIFLVGDSTVSSYDASASPRAGWGQMLQALLDKQVKVHNKAVSGRSSKSFIDEGRLSRIEEQISKGDFLFIQFGHNDGKGDVARHTDPFTTYRLYLTKYIETARGKGAFPVLITPVQRRSFDHKGFLQETHGEYPSAMKMLAQEFSTPVIDLAAKSKALMGSLGAEKSKELFLWLGSGQHPNYPAGIQDDTHFSEYGARQIAKLIIEGLVELQLPLSKYVK